jgi:hypothetical protein
MLARKCDRPYGFARPESFPGIKLPEGCLVDALVKRERFLVGLAPQSGLELTTLRLIADTSECRVFFRSDSKQESSWVLDQRLDLGVNRESLSQGLAPGMKSESG